MGEGAAGRSCCKGPATAAGVVKDNADPDSNLTAWEAAGQSGEEEDRGVGERTDGGAGGVALGPERVSSVSGQRRFTDVPARPGSGQVQDEEDEDTDLEVEDFEDNEDEDEDEEEASMTAGSRGTGTLRPTPDCGSLFSRSHV